MDDITITQFQGKMEGSLGGKKPKKTQPVNDNAVPWQVAALDLLHHKAYIIVDMTKWDGCSDQEKIDYLRGGFLTSIVSHPSSKHKLHFCHPNLPRATSAAVWPCKEVKYASLQLLPKV